MRIAGREIGVAPFIIAEIGVNHDGSAARAMELTESAADAGADAIKLQYFDTDRLLSSAVKLAAYQRAAGATDPVTMLRALELPIESMDAVVERAHARGVAAIVTVFSTELVAGADRLPWDAYKTASPDIIHKPLLERVAETGRPLILSTGASEVEEVRRAVGWLGHARARSVLLQCVSSYPTAPSHAALGAIAALRDLGVPVGYSDHTEGVETGALAVACGARVLEKHLTWSRSAPGPDHAASLEPREFAEYVRLVRAAWLEERAQEPARPSGALSSALRDRPEVGPPVKRVLECEREVRALSRQSVVARWALPRGHVIGPEDLTCKRPGSGLGPALLDSLIGRRTARPVVADMPMVAADVERAERPVGVNAVRAGG